MAIIVQHRSKCAALHRLRWRLQMSEQFSSETKNSETNKVILLCNWCRRQHSGQNDCVHQQNVMKEWAKHVHVRRSVVILRQQPTSPPLEQLWIIIILSKCKNSVWCLLSFPEYINGISCTNELELMNGLIFSEIFGGVGRRGSDYVITWYVKRNSFNGFSCLRCVMITIVNSVSKIFEFQK